VGAYFEDHASRHMSNMRQPETRRETTFSLGLDLLTNVAVGEAVPPPRGEKNRVKLTGVKGPTTDSSASTFF